MNYLDILALFGGKFGALKIIFTFIMSFFMGQLKWVGVMEDLADYADTTNSL